MDDRRALVEKLGLTHSRGSMYSGRCPACRGFTFWLLPDRFQCGTANGAGRLEGGCGWSGAIDDLLEWIEAGSDAPGTEGLPQAMAALDVEEDDLPSFDFDDFAVRNEIHVLASDGGVGKTTLLTAIMGAYAAECSALDRFPNRRTGPVLIVSEEDGAGIMRNRLNALCLGHGWITAQVLNRVHLLCLSEAHLDQAHWQAHILAEVERIGAIAVGFDPWFELWDGEENSNTAARPAIKYLRRLSEHATVFVSAHAGKAAEGKRKIDRIRGASALYSAARVVYFLDHDARGIAVHPLKFSRGAVPDRFVIARTVESDPENRAVWSSARLTYLTEDAAQEAGAESMVRDALKRAPGSTTSDLKEYAKSVPGINAVEVSQAIKSLANRGLITYEAGPKNSKLWSLTERGILVAGQAGQPDLPGCPVVAGQPENAPPVVASPFRGQPEASGNRRAGQADAAELPL